MHERVRGRWCGGCREVDRVDGASSNASPKWRRLRNTRERMLRQSSEVSSLSVPNSCPFAHLNTSAPCRLA